MKKIQVSDQCMGCGICFAMSDLVEETNKGKAIPNLKVGINKNNYKLADELVNNCPVNAISIIEGGMTNKEGQEGLKELKEKAIKLLQEYPDIPVPPTSKYSFNERDYSIDIPDTKGDYEYKYSFSKAKKAAEQEFNRVMYSQINVYIQKILLEYQIKYIKPYYTCNSEEENYYTAYNEKVSNLLSKIKGEVNSLTNRTDLLANNFTEFNVFPDNSRYSLARSYQKNEIMDINKVKEVRREFDSCHKLDEYNIYWDYDSMEYPISEFFGGIERWCYCSLWEAYDKLATDIIYSVCFSDIDGYCEQHIETLVKEYNSNVKKALKDKIEQLKRL